MEWFINFIEYLSITLSGIVIVYYCSSIMKYYQQSHYKFNIFIKVTRNYYFGRRNFYIWFIIPFIFYLNNLYVQIVYCCYLIFLIVNYLIQKQIVKLKFTSRIYRNLFSIVIFQTIFGTLTLYYFELNELVSALALNIFLLPSLVFISSILIYPIELLISSYYQSKAKLKLKKINPYIIGITGSFGKTSTKNILNSFLNENFITLASPKSYNTLNGISITINDLLDTNTETLILEMGASKLNDIKKLTKLARPKIGVVTGVTNQHIETFKSLNNIVNEKMQIIECLGDGDVGFINGDDEALKKYKIKSKAKIITFGFNSNNDYYASDLKVSNQEMEFTIISKSDKFNIKTSLLGRHNILNILCAAAISIYLGVDKKTIIYKASILEPTKHRLSIEKVNNITIIDDSFNSNIVGFKNAIEVLSYYDKPRILITPGIVEAGSLEAELNNSVVTEIASVFDEVILVENSASRHIYNGLLDINYNNVLFVDNFINAREYVIKRYEKASVLIENDISDIYKI